MNTNRLQRKHKALRMEMCQIIVECLLKQPNNYFEFGEDCPSVASSATPATDAILMSVRIGLGGKGDWPVATDNYDVEWSLAADGYNSLSLQTLIEIIELLP